jgi:peroxiredoxin
MHKQFARPVSIGAMGLLAVALGFWLSAAEPSVAAQDLEIGKPAPLFTATDSNGRKHALADYMGKVVVLEWTNHDCPYTVKHYVSNNMQGLQKEATQNGVVWLTVVSSSPGTQGYVTSKEANDLTTKRSAAPSAVLLDPDGTVGRAYGAKTTPHMYVIDKNGKLQYMGAIDSMPTSNPADVGKAQNYVRDALSQVGAGKPVATPVTRPYGCTVKYKTTS